MCGYECVCVWWDVPVFLNEHNVFEWLLIHITISYLYCMYSGRRNYNLVKFKSYKISNMFISSGYNFNKVVNFGLLIIKTMFSMIYCSYSVIEFKSNLN